MSTLTPNLLYYGEEVEKAKPVFLNAGPLTMRFDPDLAFLRHIRMGDHELLRGVYAAVRDSHWRTIVPQVSNFQVEAQTEESFHLTFDVVCREGEIDFYWRGEVTGDKEGKVVFKFDGECQSTFWNNRIGLCVLHPMVECLDKACTVKKVDGSTEQSRFPHHIEPFQIFKEVRSLTYEPAPGVQTEITFEGDSFETEDQRNWTDASFKTYSGSVDGPMPLKAEAGSRIEQRVTLSLPGRPKKILPVVLGRDPQLSISTTPVFSKPSIGLSLARNGERLNTEQLDLLKRLQLAHLRVNLDLTSSRFTEILTQAHEEAEQLGAILHLGLYITDDAESQLDSLVRQIESLKPRVSLWLIFHQNETVTQDRWVRLARQKLSQAVGGNLFVAAGTNGNFVEMNRNRPPESYGALPCYSITPQIHAFDNTTMVENLAAQPTTVDSARQICPQSVVISPITLRPHYLSPQTQYTREATPSGQLPPDVDPRQATLFAAGWTIGSLGQLTTTGQVHSLTYFETVGWRGILPSQSSPPTPVPFPSLPGSVYPLYHVFAEMAGFQRIYATQSSHPLQVRALTLVDNANRRRILVANLVDEPQSLKIKTGSGKAQVRYLDESTVAEALTSPQAFASQEGEMLETAASKIALQLAPYGIAFVDM